MVLTLSICPADFLAYHYCTLGWWTPWPEACMFNSRMAGFDGVTRLNLPRIARSQLNFRALKQQNSLLVALTLLSLLTDVASAQALTVVRYTKEELAAGANPVFIKSADLSDVLTSKISLIAVGLTARQGGANVAVRDVAASAAQKDKARYQRGLATMTLDPNQPTTRGDTDKLRVTLAQQTRKTTEVKFKDAFPLFERIRKGLNYRFDATGGRSNMPVESSAPTIRYGLIETDIQPHDNPIPMTSTESLDQMSLGYSRPAKIIYTIDRLDAKPNARVFPEPSLEANPEIGSAAPQNTSMWTRVPSSKVDVTIDAADSSAAVSDSVGQAKAPGVRATVTQMDGFVSVQAVSSDPQNPRTTTLKAPLYGEMSISRKMNSKWKAIETAATNILGSSSRPRVNLVYAHVDRKVRGEMIIKKDRMNYTITAEARQGWASESERKLDDRIAVGLATSF